MFGGVKIQVYHICPADQTAKQTRVRAHAFWDNHFGSVVVNLTVTYYILSQRYICNTC